MTKNLRLPSDCVVTRSLDIAIDLQAGAPDRVEQNVSLKQTPKTFLAGPMTAPMDAGRHPAQVGWLKLQREAGTRKASDAERSGPDAKHSTGEVARLIPSDEVQEV